MDVGVILIRLFVNIVPVLAALYTWMCIRFWRQGKKSGNPWYSLLLLCCAVFAIEYYLEMQIENTAVELALRCVSFLMLASLPAFGILFIRRLTMNEAVPRRLQATLFSLTFVLWLLFVLNPLHGLFYGDPFHRSIGGYKSLYFTKGPLFFALYGYCGAFLVYALWKLRTALRATKQRSDRHRYILLMVFFASLLPCILWLFLGLDRIIDPTPIFLLFLGSVSLWGEGKNDLMQIQLVRWENMFGNCAEPAFLFKEGDEFKKANKEASLLPGVADLEPSELYSHLERAITRRKPAGFPPAKPVRWLDVRKSEFDVRRGLNHYQMTDVTDRRSQHQLLRASEEQYRLLITQMQQGLAVFDVGVGRNPDEFICLHGNEAFAKSVGVEAAALLPGQRMGSVFPILDEGWEAALLRAAKGEEVPRFERYWNEKKRYFGIRVYAPLPGQVAVILSDITSRKAIEQELRTKDKLLLTIIGLTQDLLGVQDYRQIIPRVLALMGEALDVSRGYLFESAYTDGKLCTVSQKAEWCANDAVSQIDNPNLQEVSAGKMQDILPLLQEGKAFLAHVADLPSSNTRMLMEGQDIQSVLILPVFAGDLFWGFVGFDECRQRREWTVMEQGVLRLFADSLGRAVERYDNEQKLRSVQERNAAMLHAIPDLFFIITPEGRITHYHASFRPEELYDPPERFINKLVADVLPPETAEPMLSHVMAALAQNAMQVFEYSLDYSGRIRHFEGRLLPINQESVLLLARDITERKLRLEKIEYLSYHDQLTGLNNRRRYMQQIVRMERPDKLPLAIIMADLNGLKLTNDAFGHQMGDVLLTRTSEVLRRLCDEDMIFHMGGDEFVLLLPCTDATAAEACCRCIAQEIANESTGMLVFSASIGFAVKHSLAESYSDVFRQAEDDMYRHKLTEGVEMRRRAVNQILQTLYQRSPREMQHSQKVGELSKKIAYVMGLTSEEAEQAYQAGVMHDIGKIGIDQKILEKTTRLDDGELKEVRRHSEVGYRLLNSVHGLAHIAPFVLEHHERWDGEGYPKGISGERINLIARIIAVADGYDAMVSPRTYKQPMTPKDALVEVRCCAGTQYDPRVARAYVEGVMGGIWEEDALAEGESEIGVQQSFILPEVMQHDERQPVRLNQTYPM
jgi:diguanylate cyclase (GGDEF)-like protein